MCMVPAKKTSRCSGTLTYWKDPKASQPCRIDHGMWCALLKPHCLQIHWLGAFRLLPTAIERTQGWFKTWWLLPVWRLDVQTWNGKSRQSNFECLVIFNAIDTCSCVLCIHIKFRSSLLTSPESLLMSSVVRAISCEREGGERERESRTRTKDQRILDWRISKPLGQTDGKQIMRGQPVTRRLLDQSPSCSDGGMLCLSPCLRSVFRSRPDGHFLLSQHKIGVNFTWWSPACITRNFKVSLWPKREML